MQLLLFHVHLFMTPALFGLEPHPAINAIKNKATPPRLNVLPDIAQHPLY